MQEEIKILFDKKINLNLTKEEAQLVEDKRESLLREGVTIWPGSVGNYYGFGCLTFCKTVDDNIGTFLANLIRSIKVPGMFGIDFHGLIRNKDGLQFVWASQGSMIQLFDSKRSKFLIESKDTRQKLTDFFEKSSPDNLLETWFQAHDRRSDYIYSGFSPEKLLACMAYFEPISVNVKNLFP